jgi:hypothetical protein
MGCLASQKKIEDRPIPINYRLIWRKCLRVDHVVLSEQKRKEHSVFAQIAKDIDRTFPGHPYFDDPYNKQRF